MAGAPHREPSRLAVAVCGPSPCAHAASPRPCGRWGLSDARVADPGDWLRGSRHARQRWRASAVVRRRVPTVSSAIVDGHRRSGAAASEVLAETGRRRARPASAQVWPGPPSRSALRVWPCYWCGATAPERRELFPRSARCPITACSAFGVGVPLTACHRANGSEVKPSPLCGSWASPLCPAPLAPRAPLDFFLNLCLPPWGVSDKFPRSWGAQRRT